MAQTERSASDYLARLANNIAGDISPTDLRDAFASMMGYGSIHLNASGAPAVMSDVETTFELVNIFDDIAAQSSDENLLGMEVELASSYSLTPGSDGVYYGNFFASFSASQNNRLVTFRPFINAVQADWEISRFLSTGSDTGVVSFSSCLPLSADDVVDMRVKINTGTADLTFLGAGLTLFRVG